MSNSTDNSSDSNHVFPQLFLRRRDQWTIAGALLFGLAILGYGTWRLPSEEALTVDVDQALRKPAPFRLDANSASAAEWALLPEIGPTLANRIVEYRDSHGPFKALEQLRKVNGIGPKKFAAMRPFLLPIVIRNSPHSANFAIDNK